MPNTLMQIIPLAAIFVAGILLRKYGPLRDQHSSQLVKLVFYAGLPAVIFIAIIKVQVDSNLIFLAILSPVIICITAAVGLLLRRSLFRRASLKTFAAMLAGASMMNQGFLMPYILASYGVEGLVRLSIIGTSNIIMVFSLLYVIIAAMGNKRPKVGKITLQVLRTPTLWALVLAVAYRLGGGSLPGSVENLFEPLALTVSYILLFSVGIRFRARLNNPLLFLTGICLRFVLGALIGFCLIKLFGLHGLDAQVILIASMAPAGLNSITLVEVEKLDVDFAVSAVSISLVIGLVATPFVIYLVQSGIL